MEGLKKYQPEEYVCEALRLWIAEEYLQSRTPVESIRLE